MGILLAWYTLEVMALNLVREGPSNCDNSGRGSSHARREGEGRYAASANCIASAMACAVSLALGGGRRRHRW